MAFPVLSGTQKKCLEDAIAEDTIGIAHDDDLQLIEDVVCYSQSLEFLSEVNQ